MYLKKGKEGSNASSRRVAIAFNLEAVFFFTYRSEYTILHRKTWHMQL